MDIDLNHQEKRVLRQLLRGSIERRTGIVDDDKVKYRGADLNDLIRLYNKLSLQAPPTANTTQPYAGTDPEYAKKRFYTIKEDG